MMTIETGRLLGTLRTESVFRVESDGAGSPPRTDYRPEHTPLLNDGRWHHWMIPGEDYEVEHDGTGWRVTCRSWPSTGHTYRLADSSTWTLSGELPTDRGTVALEIGRTYVLRSTGNRAWALHEAA